MTIGRLHGRNGVLSARQEEIASLVVSGKSTREIAETLVLSPRTVETHVGAIFAKLGVRTRVELTALVIRKAAPEAAPEPKRSALPSLIGRARDVVAIADLLSKTRVVTILGTGGIGKTQVSLRVLELMRETFPDGVWVLELGSLADGSYVPGAVAQVFGVALSQSDVLASLSRQLASKRALLLFDNCEHVTRDVGAVVSTIVKACDGITILATSREALRISTEHVYRLPALGASDANELFVERARALDDRFAADGATASTIAEICRRLDGVPLAIELAAARINLFAPAQILERIERRLEILQSASTDIPARHQSMVALIDWSYDNLGEAERALFRRLGIFVGSFTLEAALAIAPAHDVREHEVVERLASLIDKSLVMVERENEAFRYRLLETTRVYAIDKLRLTAEFDSIAARHVRYLGDRFTAMRARARGWYPPDLLHALRSELGDIRAALDDAYGRADFEAGARLLASLGYLWACVGLDREGVSRNEAYFVALAGNIASFALLPGLVDLLYKNGRGPEAAQYARRSLGIARELGDPGALAMSLQVVAATETQTDVIEELMREASALGNRSAELERWYELRKTYIESRTGQFEAAERRLKALLADTNAAGDVPFSANIIARLGRNEYRRGNLAGALTYGRESIRVMRSFGNVSLLALQLYEGACYSCLAGDAAAATAALHEALSIAASIDPCGEMISLLVECIAFPCALRGEIDRAAMLLAYAAPRSQAISTVFGTSELRERLATLIATARGEAELAELRRRGELFTPQQAIELALS